MIPSFSRRDSLRLDASESMARRTMISLISLCALSFYMGSISMGTSQLPPMNFSPAERMALVVGDFQPEGSEGEEGFAETHQDWDGRDERSAASQEDITEQYQHLLEIQTENELLKQRLDKKQGRIHFLKKKMAVNIPADQTITEKILFSKLAMSSHFVRGEIIDLIMNAFTSPDSPDDTDTTLDSAFEAIDLKHTDGDAVQVNGFPFLYVGSVGASLNRESLLEQNITHVVNWSNSARCNIVDGVEYLCVRGIRVRKDMSRPESVEKLSDAVEFVERARLAGGNVMSHCWYGKNRSVTLLVAYLMKYAGMEIKEATNLVAETRPVADPHVEALELYRDKYLSKNDS